MITTFLLIARWASVLLYLLVASRVHGQSLEAGDGNGTPATTEKQAEEAPELRLYPNPSPDGVATVLAAQAADEVTFYSPGGQAVCAAKQQQGRMVVQGLTTGEYTARLRYGDKLVVRRVRVE